jgi:hypothetical protein
MTFLCCFGVFATPVAGLPVRAARAVAVHDDEKGVLGQLSIELGVNRRRVGPLPRPGHHDTECRRGHAASP